MEFSEVVRIDRPIDDVFEAWLRLDRAVEYAPGVLDRSALDDRPLGKGSRLAAVDRWPGFALAYQVELTAVERPARIAATLSEPLSGGWDAIFERADGVTELRLEVTLDPGPPLGLAFPLLRPWVRRRWHETVAGFGRWLEDGD